MAPSRRRLIVLAAVAAGVAIGAVCLAPAALIDAQVARTTAGVLRVKHAQGTVWDGRGVLVAGAAEIPLAWRIEAWPILRREFQVRLRPDVGAGGNSPRADIAIIGERAAIRDAEVTFPASLFVAASRMDATWAAGGHVVLSATALDWAPPANRGAAQIQWHGARLFVPAGNIAIDLGDVAMNVLAAGDQLTGPVSNTGGDLAVTGEITLRANDAIRVSLVFAPRRADAGQLTQMLAAIAIPDTTGWRVDWRLPLR